MYSDLVFVFYSNLSFRENVIHSRVKNIDIAISLEEFTRNFHLSCEGVDVFHLDFDDFEYPDGETALTPPDYFMMMIIQAW